MDDDGQGEGEGSSWSDCRLWLSGLIAPNGYAESPAEKESYAQDKGI